MRSTARNTKNGKIVDVDLDILCLQLDSEFFCKVNLQEAQIVYSLIECSPRYHSLDELADVLGKSKTKGDSSQFIRKKVCSLRKKLIGPLTNLIETMVSHGYRLHHDWEKINNFNKNDEVSIVGGNGWDDCLVIIGDIIDESVKMMETVPFKKKTLEDGRNELTLNASKVQDKVRKNCAKLFEASVDLLALVRRGCPRLFSSASNILFTIDSYVAMSRRGYDITEELWRELYVVELSHHFNSLKCLINQR